MKLTYKGKLKSKDDLPIGNLPPHAVMFREPKDEKKLNLIASIFIIPTVLLIILIVIISTSNNTIGLASFWGLLGLPLAFLFAPIHELLHGVCFGKNATVSFYYTKQMAMTYSNDPVSKRRFIWISICPNLFIAWIPIIIWAFIPLPEIIAGIVFMFGAFSAMLGIGDYLNIFNAFTQMPKGSMQQLSGFNSYWYMPEK